MTSSFKMLVLLALLQDDRFSGEATIDELCDSVRRLARRSARVQQERPSISRIRRRRRLLETNPIGAWTGGKGTDGRSYFAYDGRAVRPTFGVADADREAFAELVREIADWRSGEGHCPNKSITVGRLSFAGAGERVDVVEAGIELAAKPEAGFGNCSG